MDEIRRVAVGCIGRAVMFGSLAIGCVMIGFSFNPVSAFRAGAFLTLTMVLALMWKATTAGSFLVSLVLMLFGLEAYRPPSR
ncbi:hypothetical protein LRP31_05025 [Mesorhizobium mediterraneum]|uniref:Uncharacterized protein n=1 Tax=Mesorhizobium mediterraneum TaxID=43617 RepID=A0AB36RCR0_9HYPH|nr:hypothetical protein [Mesorhizobium mediterraneum]PAQ02376.1 hypothetical protein CIT25_13515 [Mesorhizobium mediterraneum]RWN44366.1 MAG: hypothetical protein EOR96_04390 [Mesorhizobium sp.]WIW54608.1 hypothetical protein LRP31_05025 [Mesorhizobium mediterraneum]